jgi:hypothetical protein
MDPLSAPLFQALGTVCREDDQGAIKFINKLRLKSNY